MKFVKDYLDELKKTIDTLNVEKIKEIAKILLDTRDKEQTIFLCGNGGSAACAAHMANDLAKLTIRSGAKRFRVISLTDNLALLTAWANDNGYDQCFVEPLKNLYREGDILIGISASGNSKNVLQAIEFVNKNKGRTIGFTGFSGGKLAGLAKKVIIANSDNMQRIEDIHIILSHLICSYICHLPEKTANQSKG